MNTVINYCLNKFVPYGILLFVIFYEMDYLTFYPYVASAFVLFIDRFSFKTGYAVAYCEARNIDLDNPPEE